MSRIRTIKPELFRHEALFDAERASGLPLRLIFMGLLTCCDKEGRFKWRPRQLKLDILPYDDGIYFTEALDVLVKRGFIFHYEVNQEQYGCIPTWHKHQCVNNKEKESTLPSIDEGHPLSHGQDNAAGGALTDKSTVSNDASSTRAARVDDALPTKPLVALESLRNSRVEGEGEKEGNMEREGEENNLVAPARPSSCQTPIESVFLHWKTVMQHAHAKLDLTRQRLIGKALQMGYTVENLCEAITGCSLTPHNRGENDRQQRYDGLHIILRNSDQIDRFRYNARNPPRLLSRAEQFTQANTHTVQTWLSKKTKTKEPSDERH